MLPSCMQPQSFPLLLFNLTRGINYQSEKRDLKVSFLPEYFVFQTPAVTQALGPPGEPHVPENKCVIGGE